MILTNDWEGFGKNEHHRVDRKVGSRQGSGGIANQEGEFSLALLRSHLFSRSRLQDFNMNEERISRGHLQGRATKEPRFSSF